VGHDLTAPAAPDPTLHIIAPGEDNRQIEIRNHDQELAAVAGRRVIAIGALSDSKLREVPGVGVVGLAVELGELVRIEPSGRRRDVHVLPDVRVLRDHLLATDAGMLPVTHMRLNMTVIMRRCVKWKTGSAVCFWNKDPMQIRDALGRCR
jgi:hypothetical protein